MNYTVKAGDSLWKIAGNELGNPMLWQRIFAANGDVIHREQKRRGIRNFTPDMIFPGTVLKLPRANAVS